MPAVCRPATSRVRDSARPPTTISSRSRFLGRPAVAPSVSRSALVSEMPMRRPVVAFFVLCLGVFPIAQTRSKGLDLYLIDVEGGGATLFVTPSRESVLID